jgi:molybdenum cofactor cytidylyltransferase
LKIAAIILAAGGSSRFEDGHKLLVEIDGAPIIRHACAVLAQSKVDDIVLVTSEHDGAITKAAGPGRWRVVENPNAREGLSTSLRVGLHNIGSDSDGLLVALGDMPGIKSALVDTLLSAFKRCQGRAIVFPASPDGQRGHPIIWPKALFAELQTVTGDSGGKTILADHKNLWHPVAYEGPGAFADIDTRADLEAFRAADQTTRRK